MSRITITLPNMLVDELQHEVKAKSKTEAIMIAIKDEIRARKMAKIKAMAGKMEFVLTAEELRHKDRRLG
ncbi:MAG: DUF2191 domain-containing protein [Nitrospirae bacterium]|nr:DUF2191 domain-containing protein [Nitrospirota bacterium]